MTPLPPQLIDWLRQVPNQMTLARFLVAPLLVLLYPIGWGPLQMLCAILFGIAAATDFLDGYLARRMGSVSDLGALLDPIADKALVAAAIVALVSEGHGPAWILGVILIRDTIVSGIRLAAAERQLTIPVHATGKWKTFIQDVALLLLLVPYQIVNLPTREIGHLLLWAALGLSIYSAYLYGLAYWSKALDCPDQPEGISTPPSPPKADA